MEGATSTSHKNVCSYFPLLSHHASIETRPYFILFFNVNLARKLITSDETDTPNPTTSPTSATNSTAPPPSDEATSSPPTPSAAPPPSPPASSPPPPKSSPPPNPSPPPPATPPPKSEAPPPEEQKLSPPPPDQSPPPKSPPAKSPSPEKSPATPPPAVTSSPPPPSVVTPSPASVTPPSAGSTPPPPAATTVFSPPPPAEKSSAALSPPPPAAGTLPPTPSGSSASEFRGKSTAVSPPPSSSSVSTGVIAVVAVIGVAIVAMVVLCIVFAVRKKKRKENYNGTPATGVPKGDYYNGSNWNTPQNLPQPPGLMGTPPGGPLCWTPPPLPPGGNSSGDYSSGFSGPHPNSNRRTPSPNMGLSNQSSFSYEELARATNGFAQENVIGQGGFGYVHKGVLPNGKEVAVKSLKAGSGQGEREFQAEVEIISRVHHRHLVSLVGYCIADERRMLVYEFVPNKTLEFHLHGKDRPTMDWPTRMRIALGAAKGLGYLHEDCHPRIIHRDIKAANILLDYKFEAMVADFGLAKLTSDNFTHVSTRVMGTFGYMAPEYASSGKLTDKSDVFSFGVMLLELITGRRPIDPNQIMEDSLVDWARPIMTRVLEDHNYEELVDPCLENNFDPNEMERMIACASASIRHSARRRPKMTQIVRTLEGDQSSLNDTPTKSTPETLVYDTKAYNADMMKFKKMINSSNDFGSSEYEHTSEYGLQPSSSSSDMASQEYANSGPQRQRL